MKRILVAIFAIWTFAMFGQNVDPETFPLLSGSIGDKHLYTNTSGEGKISIKTIWDSVKITDTVSTSYADFYTLITGGNLQAGKTYILIDFQTIYDQIDFDASGNLKSSLTTKTGAIEEIWVLALAPDRIASTAYSKTYPNDRIQYDWTYNTTLVNGSPAKGRISERIDEWNNRTDYDHRVIKFIRYDDGSGNYVQINDSGRTAKEYLTFGDNYGAGGIIYDNWLGDFYSIGAFFGQEYGNNVFNGSIVVSNKTSSLFHSNTFSGGVNSNTFSGDVHKNTFSGGVNSNNFSGYVHSNTFSGGVNSNTFSGDVYSNTFSGDVHKNTFSGGVNSNNFSGYVNSNTFSGGVNSNTFSGGVNSNTFSGGVNSNTFIYTSYIKYVYINNILSNKTIDELTYPFLFGTDYKKEIFQASNGNIYARYFDGTNDINTLIP